MVKIIEVIEEDDPQFSTDVLFSNTSVSMVAHSSPVTQSEDSLPDSHHDDDFPSTSTTAIAVMDPPVKDDSIRKIESESGSIGGGWLRWHRPSILGKAKMGVVLKKVGLGLRILGFVFSVISFSVMAADRDKGWALDSFKRYKEFRYCLSVTVVAAGYCGVQMYYLFMDAGRFLPHHFRCYLDFSMDQILSYLLISASSSGAVRVDEWRSNWGKDMFPYIAAVSVGMSFMAFFALALSSIISGYGYLVFKAINEDLLNQD